MAAVLSIVMPYQSERDLNLALELNTLACMKQIEWYRLPRLYKSGVRYAREVCRAPNVPGACERFLSAAQLIAEGEGDCDDLACYRAAELRLEGDTRARAFAVRSPGIGWHCLVRRGDGRVEDPSLALGMKV